jgi:S1-C subfamily serine protease
MRLYSGRQLVAAVLCSVGVGAGLFAVAVLVRTASASPEVTVAAPSRSPAALADQLPVSDGPTPIQGLDGYTEDERNSIRIYEALNSAVVNITAITVQYDWFLNAVPQEGTGSGSILDQLGHVVTNFHVVENAEKINITLADGTEFEGHVVGKDPQNDLAVVKFDPGGMPLTTIPFGSSAELRVGQKTLAIGNPFGLERTLTTGIVSGLGRPIRTDSGYIIRETIQTDASINPGNSGGPLLNSRGQMIGINTSIYSPSGGSIGLGFAVPVDTARRVVPELIKFGEVRRGWIGVAQENLVQLSSRLSRYLRLSVEEGVLVSVVTPGSAAEKAGLKGGDPRNRIQYGRSVITSGGDIIVAADKEPVATIADLFAALEDNRPGDTVEVKVIRNRSEVVLRVVLDKMP